MLGGVYLKVVRIMLRVVAALVLLFGLYLIFYVKQFLGLFLIIAAFLILPSLDDQKKDNSFREKKVKSNSSGDS